MKNQQIINIKPIHRIGIEQIAKGYPTNIVGSKLIALYNLIQKKGEPMVSEDKRYNGVKVIWYSKTDGVGFIRQSTGKSFFPCVLRTIQITKL